jgi:hypothetical protein
MTLTERQNPNLATLHKAQLASRSSEREVTVATTSFRIMTGPKKPAPLPPAPAERQYRGNLIQEIHLIDLCSVGFLEVMNRI